MSIKKRLITGMINPLLGLFDLAMVRKSELDKFRKRTEIFYEPSFNATLLPDGASEYLKNSNPWLKELRQRYSSLECPATDHSIWSSRVNDSLNLQYFRGDNAYVWQYRARNTEEKYLLTAYYVKTIDKLNLLNLLQEDQLFGVYTFKFDNFTISRDLLDSMVEIYFLEQILGISKLSNINILDIGAGYGRLPYRMVKGLPNIGKVFCVDAVAESTFLSEYYLAFRGVNEKAIVVPIYEIQKTLSNNSIFLALNIHSFSECKLTAINWWLDLLKQYKVKYLMVVPNPYENGGTKLLTRESNEYDERKMLDFLPAITSKGYKLIVRQPKYLDTNLQRYGVSPTYHYLFELAS